MDTDDQIIGYRQDRIGARLICLLNVMRLARRFGVGGRFLWLGGQGGEYPELADPHDFFAPEFVAAHITVIDHPPDLSALPSVGALAQSMNAQGFAAKLAAGQRYECDTMSETVRFMDEPLAEAEAELREIAKAIRLAAPLERALRRMRADIAKLGGGDPVAIHVRRGDILDGVPWSYTSWATKYVPDEFYRAFMSLSDGPVISFSDTPEAVVHLGRGDPRILPVAALFKGEDLAQPARDLLELLLMSDCASVGAPSHSAFSRAAAVTGRCRILALPAGLPEDLRVAAYDALLDRVIGDPDSFFAPGDMAQTANYAAKHAAAIGRGKDLVDALAGREEFLERFPFVYKDLALTAWAEGRMGKARDMAERGLAAPLLRHRDKPQCRQVLLVADAGSKPEENPQIDAQFLTMLFTGRAAEGPIIPALAHRLLRHGAASMQALMFDPKLMTPYTRISTDGGRETRTLPLWTLRLDWSEFINDKMLQQELRNWPSMWDKIKPIFDGLTEAEEQLANGDKPGVNRAEAARYGYCASILRLHGRFKRSFALLHWLNDKRPGEALIHKRFADTCFAANQRHAGWKWLKSALQLAPENAMLRLSAAIRAAQQRDPERGKRHAAEAEAAWPDLPLTKVIERNLTKFFM